MCVSHWPTMMIVTWCLELLLTWMKPNLTTYTSIENLFDHSNRHDGMTISDVIGIVITGGIEDQHYEEKEWLSVKNESANQQIATRTFMMLTHLCHKKKVNRQMTTQADIRKMVALSGYNEATSQKPNIKWWHEIKKCCTAQRILERWTTSTLSQQTKSKSRPHTKKRCEHRSHWITCWLITRKRCFRDFFVFLGGNSMAPILDPSSQRAFLCRYRANSVKPANTPNVDDLCCSGSCFCYLCVLW